MLASIERFYEQTLAQWHEFNARTFFVRVGRCGVLPVFDRISIFCCTTSSKRILSYRSSFYVETRREQNALVKYNYPRVWINFITLQIYICNFYVCTYTIPTYKYNIYIYYSWPLSFFFLFSLSLLNLSTVFSLLFLFHRETSLIDCWINALTPGYNHKKKSEHTERKEEV